MFQKPDRLIWRLVSCLLPLYHLSCWIK